MRQKMLSSLLVLIGVWSVCHGQGTLWVKSQWQSSSTCSANADYYYGTNLISPCSPSACSACATCTGAASEDVTCQVNTWGPPAAIAFVVTYSDAACTIGNAKELYGLRAGLCQQLKGGGGSFTSIKLDCSNGVLTSYSDIACSAGAVIKKTWPTDGSCGTGSGNTGFNKIFTAPGCSLATTSPTTATPTPTTTPASTVPSSSAPCFHKDTLVTYKDQKNLRLSDLEHHPECRIPHTVIADGVTIETNKGHVLRLTDDHLVYTATRGLVPAAKLAIGDTLFTSLTTLTANFASKNGDTCTVTQVTPESGETYFGLNCLDSVVLANGIKTSTFGRYHTIPAWWMRVAGSVFGAHTASSVGDSLVQFLNKIKLL